jgi:hypothetical protein
MRCTEHRVELAGFTDGMLDRLKALGLVSEIISWRVRLFVPVAIPTKPWRARFCQFEGALRNSWTKTSSRRKHVFKAEHFRTPSHGGRVRVKEQLSAELTLRMRREVRKHSYDPAGSMKQRSDGCRTRH